MDDVKLTHDATAGAMYIELVPRPRDVARTVEIDDGTNVDLDADGRLLGIEVLNPRRNWPLYAILKRWDVSDDDAAMLMMGYPFMLSAQVA